MNEKILNHIKNLIKHHGTCYPYAGIFECEDCPYDRVYPTKDYSVICTSEYAYQRAMKDYLKYLVDKIDE